MDKQIAAFQKKVANLQQQKLQEKVMLTVCLMMGGLMFTLRPKRFSIEAIKYMMSHEAVGKIETKIWQSGTACLTLISVVGKNEYVLGTLDFSLFQDIPECGEIRIAGCGKSKKFAVKIDIQSLKQKYVEWKQEYDELVQYLEDERRKQESID